MSNNRLSVPDELMAQIEAINAEMSNQEEEDKEDSNISSQMEDMLAIDDEDEEEYGALEELQEDVLKDNSQEEVLDESEEALEEPQYSEIELEAMKIGWKPKDQYKDAPEDFVEAKEYIARGPIIQHTKQQKKEIQALKQAVQEIANNLKMAEQRGREQAMQELLQNKQAAYKLGNLSEAERLEQEHQEMLRAQLQDKLNKPQEEEPQTSASIGVAEIKATPAWAAFEAKNPWIGSNKAEHVAIRDKASALAARYTDIVGEDNFTTEHVPEMIKFIELELAPKPSPNRNKPSAVSPTRGRAAAPSDNSLKSDLKKLSKTQRDVYELCCTGPNPTIKPEEYIKSLKDNGGLQ